MFGLTKEVINLECVFAEIRMSGFRADPIGRALLKSIYWLRIQVEKGQAIRAQPSCRDHVPGEGRADGCVVYDANPAEIGVGRFKQFAEVAFAHREAGNNTGIRRFIAPFDPFFGVEEEQLIAVRIEMFRDEHRTADVEAVLIETIGRSTRRDFGYGAVIAGPSVGVERRVAKVL